jgi:[acyl-carrier-protein] S-malonyltransferase
MKKAIVFPGQGSQTVGMGRALFEEVPVARRVFEEADEALEFELSKLCFDGPEDELRLTANTQPAILTVSVAAWRALEERGIKPDYVAGHSLGEYSALVAAGSLKFNDAVRAVRSRGLFMQEAVPAGVGAMAALIGGRTELVDEICREASENGVCSPANLNSPNQTVIAGHSAAVQRAVELAKSRGIKRAVLLSVSAPFHCELMGPAAVRLKPVLDAIELGALTVPLVTNVDAGFVNDGKEARQCLLRQVASPVRWRQSVELLLSNGVTTFIEAGPGKVLSGLIGQISRDRQVLNVEDPRSLDATVAALER